MSEQIKGIIYELGKEGFEKGFKERQEEIVNELIEKFSSEDDPNILIIPKSALIEMLEE